MLRPSIIVAAIKVATIVQTKSYPITNVYYSNNLHVMSSSIASLDNHKKPLLHNFSARKDYVEEYLTIEINELKLTCTANYKLQLLNLIPRLLRTCMQRKNILIKLIS
jgi:hypothetical protein